MNPKATSNINNEICSKKTDSQELEINEIYSKKTDLQELEILAPKKLSVGDTICVLEPSRTTEYRTKIFEERLTIVKKNLGQDRTKEE